MDPAGRAAIAYGVSGVPETFFLDAEGTDHEQGVGGADRVADSAPPVWNRPRGVPYAPPERWPVTAASLLAFACLIAASRRPRGRPTGEIRTPPGCSDPRAGSR